ncbi:sensor histidine kinase [Nocardioides dilutus]
MLSRLGWSLAVATALLVAADVVVSAQAVSLTSETAIAVHGFPLVHGACLGSALMGALIVSRYERHPIGWLLSCVGIFTSVSLLTEAYAYWTLEADGPGSDALGSVSAWVAQLFGGQIVVAILALMFLLAPNGHFLSRRWRRTAVVPGVGALLCLAAIVSADPTGFDLVDAEERLGAVRVTMLSVGFTLITLGMVLGLVCMVQRLRASSGEERQQLRLVALSAALAALGLVNLAVVQAVNGGQQTWYSGVPLFVSFFLMPILFALAALRYRLYELDVIINRTVVVVSGAAFAAVGYTTLVVAAGQLVEGRTGGFWLSLLGTVVVALAFQPLRRYVVKLANRVAYGARAQPYEALADFSRRLAEAPDPDDLLSTVAEAAARAVSARGARASLDVPGSAPVHATWGWWPVEPDEAAGVAVVPVVNAERELGRLAVVLPRGHALRPSDHRLLEALADQAAVAFGNTSLAGAVADRVADLARTTDQLTASRRRLIAAEDAARRALEAAISRDVLPSLRALPAEIRRARADLARGRDTHLDDLVEQTNRALESLRDLTRGVFPSHLARSGLEPALRSLLARAGTSTVLTIDESARRRYSARVEAAVYFCCTEALRTHAGASSVDLLTAGDDLVLRIVGTHDGIDLQGIEDRVEAVGGALAAREGLLVLTIPVATPGVTSLAVDAEGSPDDGQSERPDVLSASAQTAESRSGPNAAFGM